MLTSHNLSIWIRETSFRSARKMISRFHQKNISQGTKCKNLISFWISYHLRLRLHICYIAFDLLPFIIKLRFRPTETIVKIWKKTIISFNWAESKFISLIRMHSSRNNNIFYMKICTFLDKMTIGYLCFVLLVGLILKKQKKNKIPFILSENSFPSHTAF